MCISYSLQEIMETKLISSACFSMAQGPFES